MTPLITINNLIGDAKYNRIVRMLRWPDGKVIFPLCESTKIDKHGHHNTQPERQRYFCNSYCTNFNDLLCTIFAGRHQPLRNWILCCYFMGLDLCNLQIAHELDLDEDDVQQMTTQLHEGINDKKPPTKLEGSVESDEIYIVPGHKGNPEVVGDKGRNGRRNRLKEQRGCGTLSKEKPPILTLIQRGGDIALTMLENVKQKTIEPIIQTTIAPGTLIYTDEYNIYRKLTEWGYQHKTVCHSKGEFVRDEGGDGDGFCEVYVDTKEGFWYLLQSWLRPHRGISQEKLPQYLGFLELVHNVRRRGNALWGSLLNLFLS